VPRASISRVKTFARLLILFVALVALPLRGVAGIGLEECARQHQDAAKIHVHGDHHAHAAHSGNASHSPQSQHSADAHPAPGDAPSSSICSLCAAHCAGVSFFHSQLSSAGVAPMPAQRIDFLGRQPTGFVPDILDRPPQVRSFS